MEQQIKKTILIVDDEGDFLISLKRILERMGYRVSTAQDGVEAMERFSSNCIDVVMTDLRMPRKGGLEVLKEIKARSSSTPVIIMTAYGDQTTRKEAEEKGADAFIDKPFEMREILDLIKEVLKRKG